MLARALVYALQVVAVAGTPAPTARSLTVRMLGSRDVRHVPVVARADGQLGVNAGLLATALGGSVRRLPTGRFAVAVPGANLEIGDQSGFATSSSGVIPLPAPAWVDGTTLYLPLAVVADVLPRVASGVIYDPEKAEVRVFTALLPGAAAHAVSRHSTGTTSDVFQTVATTGGVVSGSGTDTTGVSPSGDVLLGERDDPPAPPRSTLIHRRLVVVDAGHGGPDHGMIGPVGSTHPI